MLKKYLLYLLSLSFITLTSCEKSFEEDNFEAYFGGEIINPQNNFVLFLKNDKVLDTIFLDKNNRFLHKFDSLTPGLYTFKHLPEYQYVYFDKNDSLMVRLNSFDFDNSLAFCGRGEEKNNFLIDLYLKNEQDKNNLYEVLDKDIKSFTKNIDSVYSIRKAHYLKRKAEVDWSDSFDKIAQAGLDFHHYYKKELYPYAHKYKTGNKVLDKLPKDFYDYRKKADLNNPQFANFSPFIKYINTMLSNVAYDSKNGLYDELSLENNIIKINIADTLIKDKDIKNIILYNIAYVSLLNSQNIDDNEKIVNKYLEYSTDKEQQNEVKEVYNAVKNLNIGNKLPAISLVDKDLKTVDLTKITNNKETVIFFWTSQAESHLKTVHKKVNNFQKKHPNVNFIAINVDDTNENWTKTCDKCDMSDVTEYKSTSFVEIKKQWVITKIHRAMIINPDGTIKNAFVDLFDANFEKNLN
jgi:peroxiredoxin